MLTMQWVLWKRWRPPNTSCQRCWTRSSSAHSIVQMKIRNMQALWFTPSAQRASSLVTTYCRQVSLKFFFFFLNWQCNQIHHINLVPATHFQTGLPGCSGPVSQDWGRNPTGEVVPGSVCSTSDHCWSGQHCRLGPSAGEWHTFPTLPALSAATGETERPWVADWPVPAEQGQHAEDAAW